MLFDLKIFSAGVYPPSATSRTISFSFSYSFWYYSFFFLKSQASLRLADLSRTFLPPPTSHKACGNPKKLQKELSLLNRMITTQDMVGKP